MIVADNFTTTESEGSATDSISNNSGSASGMLKDTNDDQFTVIDGGELSDLISSRLIFNKLMTSQAGEYTCKALLSIPGTNILNHTEEQPFIVIVKCMFLSLKCQLGFIDKFITFFQCLHLRFSSFEVVKTLSMKAQSILSFVWFYSIHLELIQNMWLINGFQYLAVILPT